MVKLYAADVFMMDKEARGKGKDLCAFCRVPSSTSAEEDVIQLKKLVDENRVHRKTFFFTCTYFSSIEHITYEHKQYLREHSVLHYIIITI